MALSYRRVNESAFGGFHSWTYDITGDTSYPAGGYSSIEKTFGAGRDILASMPMAGNKQANAYDAFYDSVNDKLIFRTKDGTYPRGSNLTPAGMWQIETVTVAAATGAAQLSRIPGYIQSVRVSAGGVTGAFKVIPTGKTPTTGMVAVNFTTGAMTFLAADAVTACVVQYIPLGVGPFIPANRVVDEAITLASAGGNLANRAALIQYIWNDTAAAGSRRPKLIPKGEAPGANEVAVNINNSSATTITVNAGQNGNSGLVTYWKFSALGLQYGWTDQADITATSNAALLTETNDLPAPAILGFGDALIGETGASANLQATLMDANGTLAANQAIYDPSLNKISSLGGDAYATYEMPLMVLEPTIMQFSGGEVAAGVNLNAVTFRITFLTLG